MNHSSFDLSKLSTHYSQTYELHGFNSRGADWGDTEKHHLRILSMIDLLGYNAFENKSILDVGCGYGSFFSILKSHYPGIEFSYVGIDPCEEAIDFAIKNTGFNAQFFCSDIQSFSSVISFDTVFCCGIFTKKATMSDNEMYELLARFFALLGRINPQNVSFNTMSAFCDCHDDDIFYPKYEKIVGMISSLFGYRVSDFLLSNRHLKYEMIWRFSIENE